MKRTNLHEAPGRKLARALDTAAGSGVAAHTRPAGIKHLGEDGDILWRAPEMIPDPDNPTGPPIPGPSYTTWSVKDVPVIQETLRQELADAEGRLTDARAELDAAQDEIASVVLDLDAIGGTLPGLAADITDAQATADAANTAAAQNYQAMLSRGENLVTNGTGYLGNNANFSWATFNKPLAPEGVSGVFVTPSSVYYPRVIDESIPLRLGATYNFAYQIRETVEGKTSRYFSYIEPRDAYDLVVLPGHYMFIAGTTTTLAQDLKPGDTVIKLTNPSGWYGTAGKPANASPHLRSMIAWNYIDPGGKAWPEHTYSRHWSGSNTWADGGVAADGTITLLTPWPASKGTIPAGTKVSNGSSGGSYIYRESNQVITAADGWVLKAGNWKLDPAPTATAATGRTLASFAGGWMPPGTAQVKVGWLLNFTGSDAGSRQAIGGVVFSEASAAQQTATDAATAASTAASKADAAQGTANSAIAAAGTAQTAADNAAAAADAAAVDAAAAAGVAGGKADVLIQSTAPAVGMRKATTLWIDTTGGANTPKRWVTGTGWVAVTDKTATDAAAAAAAAQSAANNAATTAQAAKDEAEDALAAAATAQGTANTAVTNAAAANTAALTASGLADSKGKVLYATSAPTGADRVAQNLWIDTAGGANTPKRWVTGTGWVPVTDKTATDAAATAAAANSLAASKITTFYSATEPAGATSGDLWIDIGVTPRRLRRRAGTVPPSWTDVTDDVLQKALTAAGDAQATADGKVRTFAQVSPPTGLVAKDVGDLWVDTDDGNKLHRWSGTDWVVVRDASIAAAQSAADAAAADAAAAAGIAGGKADVLIQSTAPAAAMRKATTLWIDTAGGANTPKRWTTGTTWVAVTDKTAVDAAAAAAAAQATAADAAAAALAAHQAADAADAKAGQALTSASGRNSRIISLTAPSGTVNPTTGLPLVTGDTWWQWDSTTARNVIGAWVWDGDGWHAETLTDSVLGSLDVNKLMVLGTARMTEAVVGKIIGDAAFFNQLKVEDLTVTEGATIKAAVIQKLAAEQIETGSLRTEVDTVTGLYAIVDSYGFRVVDNDGGPEGEPQTIVALGPDGEQLIQLGTGEDMVSINSSGGGSFKEISTRELYLDGRRIQAADVFGGPRGVVSFADMFAGRSRRLNRRDSVLGLEGSLRPGRVYKLECSSIAVDTEHGNCEPFAKLHSTIDGSSPQSNWDYSTAKESKIGPFSGFRTLPGMVHWIDLTNWDPDGPEIPLRAALSLGNYANNGWVRAGAIADRIWMVCEDLGTSFPYRGRAFYGSNSDSEPDPPPPPPTPVRYKRRWHAIDRRTYRRNGGRDESSPWTQGQWSSWNRETFFFFPDMTGTLAGATIHRVTLHSRFESWANAAGGTGSWGWHGHVATPGDSGGQYATHMIDVRGWQRGASRMIDLNPDHRGDVKSGRFRGFAFSTSNTSREYYGKLSPNLNDHWVEVEYSK